jgi:hypothetical protein
MSIAPKKNGPLTRYGIAGVAVAAFVASGTGYIAMCTGTAFAQGANTTEAGSTSGHEANEPSPVEAHETSSSDPSKDQNSSDPSKDQNSSDPSKDQNSSDPSSNSGQSSSPTSNTTTVSASTTLSAVNVTRHCTGSSMSNLQVQREDTGKLSVDFGVDMAKHVAGVPWKVVEVHNGATFVNATVKTISDGSFSLTRLVVPTAGTNAFVAMAINTVTGETCTIKASI